jgi:hypothetical protein
MAVFLGNNVEKKTCWQRLEATCSRAMQLGVAYGHGARENSVQQFPHLSAPDNAASLASL